MSSQVVYKDNAVISESAWGVSSGDTQRLIHVIDNSLNLNPNKELVEDTSGTPAGRDRMVGLRNEISGDMTFHATPRSMHTAFEMVMGQPGVSSAVGNSGAFSNTYLVNRGSSYQSKTIVIDRNKSQETFYGVRATSLNGSFSDGLVEFSLGLNGKSRDDSGSEISDGIGETLEPFGYYDLNVEIHNGATFGASANTFYVTEFDFTYENGQEVAFLSNSKDARRSDPGIPTVEGSLTIYHEGASWTSPTFGCSELFIRLSGSLESCGGVIPDGEGSTAYFAQMDFPRVEFTTNTRTYAQGEKIFETIEFTGMVEPGGSGIFIPQLVLHTDDI